ncbi:SRPBCC family protein [Herbaspirillum lusitanum]|uniref:SRPBCC family protein n=1 Tax=Herbaspirillum lusitanum TaxID=213312 RepID=A0ABW9ADB1_9BURK
MLLTSAVALLCCPGAALAQSAPQPDRQPATVSVSMSRPAGYPQFDVRAEVGVNASLQRAWQVLTDYSRLAEFVPNLDSSRELEAETGMTATPGEHVVEQHGYARFLFLKQKLELVLRVKETPLSQIDMALMHGNMRKFNARWQLSETGPDQITLSYSGLIAPDFYVPGLFGPALMRSDLREMVNAVARRIEQAPDAAAQMKQPEQSPAVR